MKIKSERLILDLEAMTKNHLDYALSLNQKSEEELNRKTNPESWNTLECLEHLNLYGNFYLPEIEKQLEKKKDLSSEEMFKSGLLGNYFAESLLPKEKLNKMKTFKNMDPINRKLDRQVLEDFINQLYKILALLEKSRTANLNKIKTRISITKWIKLRLGDTFRVVIYHNERHIKQIERIIRETNKAKEAT